MSLFEKRDHYKPFEFPWAYEAFVKSEQMHWLAREVPLSEDVKDWKTRLSSDERYLLTQIFRFFTQADVDVAGAYIDRYLPRFQAPEVRMMLSSIAAREAVHIQAYSMLIDEIGMPESEYAAFAKYAAMKEKHEFMEGSRPLIEDIAIFSAFGEGLQLFASFVILLNFTRFGKMKGMGQIVSWSIRDETHHVESMVKLFHATSREKPLTEENRANIAASAKKMVDLEDNFIDLAYQNGYIEGLEASDVKRYIRHIADIRLQQLGLLPIYDEVVNPLPWVDIIVFGKEHANFFETRATDYAKGATQGSWDDAFEDATDLFYTVYSKPNCPWCEKATELLAHHNLSFVFVEHDTPEKVRLFKDRGFTSYPQIYVNERHLGGYPELELHLGGDKPLSDLLSPPKVTSDMSAPQEGASCSLEGVCS